MYVDTEVRIDVFTATSAQYYYIQLVVVMLYFIFTAFQNSWSILVARTAL
jgi:hypothetical protein